MNNVLLLGVAALFGSLLFMSRPKHISAAGLDRLKAFEGFSATVYQDQAGHNTIGYGHLITGSEDIDYLSRSDAERLLREDLRVYENAVNSFVTVKLTQNMFDALVMLCYNIGTYAFGRSTLVKELNKGNYDAAHSEFAKWNKITVSNEKIVSAGLSNRRASEAELFIS